MSVPTAYSVAGDGPPLIMIHGIGARRATFDGMVAGLKDRFTCITYDLRGHGLTPWSAGTSIVARWRTTIPIAVNTAPASAAPTTSPCSSNVGPFRRPAASPHTECRALAGG